MQLPADIPADAEILYDVTVDDGKYRFVYLQGQNPRAYRHGVFWQPMANTMLGCKAILALVAEIAERGERETSPEIASMAGRILSAGNPLDNPQVQAAMAAALLGADGDGPETITESLRPILQPYFDNMLSLAGSSLSQREPSTQE